MPHDIPNWMMPTGEHYLGKLCEDCGERSPVDGELCAQCGGEVEIGTGRLDEKQPKHLNSIPDEDLADSRSPAEKRTELRRVKVKKDLGGFLKGTTVTRTVYVSVPVDEAGRSP